MSLLSKNKTLLSVATAIMIAFGHGPIAAKEISEVTAPVRSVVAESAIDAGRYLVLIAGCNDCHTMNWAESNGAVPEQEWLAGVPIGWRGPWGTTYAANLRATVQETSEEGWVTMLRVRTERPPMPWMNLNKMSETDARSIYQFIRSLGMRGDKMPVAVDPDADPATPYILLEPMHAEPAQVTAFDSSN